MQSRTDALLDMLDDAAETIQELRDKNKALQDRIAGLCAENAILISCRSELKRRLAEVLRES